FKGYTRSDNGKFRIDEIVWEVLEKLKFKFPEAVIDVSIDIEDEDILEINSHRELVATALMNIVDNAIKFSPDRNPEIFISKAHERPFVRVKDHGHGIPAEEVSQIYNLFYRGSN